MKRERFEKLLDELDGKSLETLKTKNTKYASDDDCLHNFNRGAELMGVTPAMAAWGYLAKHMTALSDKVHNNDFMDREDFLEKCQDAINYIRFIWCIGNEELPDECDENWEVPIDPYKPMTGTQISNCISNSIGPGSQVTINDLLEAINK